VSDQVNDQLGPDPLGRLRRRIVAAIDEVPTIDYTEEELMVLVEAVEGVVRRRAKEDVRPPAPVLKLVSRAK
jgi:hypothetical protein